MSEFRPIYATGGDSATRAFLFRSCADNRTWAVTSQRAGGNLPTLTDGLGVRAGVRPRCARAHADPRKPRTRLAGFEGQGLLRVSRRLQPDGHIAVKSGDPAVRLRVARPWNGEDIDAQGALCLLCDASDQGLQKAGAAVGAHAEQVGTRIGNNPRDHIYRFTFLKSNSPSRSVEVVVHEKRG